MGFALWTSCLLLALAFALPVVALPLADAGEERTVAIKEGSYEDIYITERGSIKYSVRVISGGPVDVYMAKYLLPGPAGSISVIEGHSHEGVESVEDILEGADGSVYLVVENGDNIGTASSGDVTVYMSWESTVTATGVLGILLGVLVFISIVIFLVAAVVRSRKKRGAMVPVGQRIITTSFDGSTYIVEDTYVETDGDEDGDASVRESGQYCPRCGAMMSLAPMTGAIWCPRCNTRVR